LNQQHDFSFNSRRSGTIYGRKVVFFCSYPTGCRLNRAESCRRVESGSARPKIKKENVESLSVKTGGKGL
jgi:hypothetical protein